MGGFLLFNTIPESKSKSPPLEILGSAVKSLDLLGFMLICPAIVMFLLGLQFGGNQYPWKSAKVIGLLIGGAVAFILFLLWEYHQGDGAMLPLAMVRHQVIWSTAMTMFFSLSSILVADFYIAIYFQAIRDDSPLMSGVHMLPITLGLVMFTMISGTLSECGFVPSRHRRSLTTTITLQSPSSATISHSSLQGEQYQPLAMDSCQHSVLRHQLENGLDTRYSTALQAVVPRQL